MTIIQLSASKDSEFQNDSPDFNNGTVTSISTGEEDGTNTVYEMALQFDVTSLIPVGSLINSAYLKMYAYDDKAAVNVTLRAYRNTASWVETTVTWNNFINSWNTTNYGNLNVANGYRGLVSIPISTTLINGWRDGSIANYGLRIRSTHQDREFESNARDDSHFDFRSREYATTSERPVLEIDYTETGGMILGML